MNELPELNSKWKTDKGIAVQVVKISNQVRCKSVINFKILETGNVILRYLEDCKDFEKIG